MEWRELWSFRGQKYKGEPAHVIDGFESGRGLISPSCLDFLVNYIEEMLALAPNDKVLEVGCGAGMLIEGLLKPERIMFGADYAIPMIERIQENVPRGHFVCAEAAFLPFRRGSFDKILCFSVFQYFSHLSYARTTMNEFQRLLAHGGRILIGDIPDLDKKDDFLKLKASIPHERNDFDNDQSLAHLFYPKKFFTDFCQSNGLRFEVHDIHLPGYENSRYRYFICIQKASR